MAIDLDKVIAGYIKLRDAKDAMETRHKEELAPLNSKMEKIEAWLQNALQSQGLRNVKSDSGTAFIQSVANVTTPDFEATMAYIKEHDMWELLDRRLSKSVVLDHIEKFGVPPPGVTVARADIVRIRRG